jgi:hypothetical protein
MRAGYMDDSLLQQRQCLRAVALRDDQFYTRTQHVAREHGDAGIAAGQQNTVGQIVFAVKELHRGFGAFRGVAHQNRIGGRQIPGDRRRRRRHGTAVHAAKLHGIAGARGIRLG